MRAQSNIPHREFLRHPLKILLLALFVECLTACAALSRAPTPTPKIFRVGVLLQTDKIYEDARLEGFRQRMIQLGYEHNRNLFIEWRFALGADERLPDLAAELVRLPVDVLVVERSATSAAKHATNTLPIVFVDERYPVASGFVTSIAHPGGNITGISNPPLIEKDLQILKEALPSLSRVAYFWEDQDAAILNSVQDAARAERVQLQSFHIKRADEIEGALESAIQQRADAILVAVGPNIFIRRSHFQSLISQKRLPSISDFRAWADAGGLLAYGANPINNWALAANLVDKILKGAKPADLPVEQPTKFDFVINLKTAKALGLTIPQSALAQATEVIQ